MFVPGMGIIIEIDIKAIAGVVVQTKVGREGKA
ncbi:hypothetical protein NIES21_45080 [Anabaenopsis circularis NIES-21]|uniref:Uncharacterized protein n=1 Tax=Anabaenopsis circularis NIES-21 TaxID=1085406 RepID=A0A1Z4GME7_9CYAN|nr:hypothetical protein NIES21_45080 [Anabaenopsis circularis NIES-21]